MFGMYVRVWNFFDGVGTKKRCLAFFEISDSVTALGLGLYHFFSGQRSSLFYHGPILQDINIVPK